MVPSAFVHLDALPLTPSGKLARRALPAPEQDAYVSRAYEAPQGELEQLLASIWQQLLGVERVGRSDNFFELGGHSLYAMRLIAKVDEQLLVSPSVATVFKHPTLQQFGEVVESLRAANADALSQEGMEYEEGVI
jgi:syringomycin synthetase protein SyrE